jgi:hypothetical protein
MTTSAVCFTPEFYAVLVSKRKCEFADQNDLTSVSPQKLRRGEPVQDSPQQDEAAVIVLLYYSDGDQCVGVIIDHRT